MDSNKSAFKRFLHSSGESGSDFDLYFFYFFHPISAISDTCRVSQTVCPCAILRRDNRSIKVVTSRRPPLTALSPSSQLIKSTVWMRRMCGMHYVPRRPRSLWATVGHMAALIACFQWGPAGLYFLIQMFLLRIFFLEYIMIMTNYAVNGSLQRWTCGRIYTSMCKGYEHL